MLPTIIRLYNIIHRTETHIKAYKPITAIFVVSAFGVFPTAHLLLRPRWARRYEGGQNG